jgi:hypothetical protein
VDAGSTLATAPQILVEFCVVATRPTDGYGLGWSPDFARTSVDAFAEQFRLLVETREAFERWRTLVTEGKIQGKRAHDARIAAVMLPFTSSPRPSFKRHPLRARAENVSGGSLARRALLFLFLTHA